MSSKRETEFIADDLQKLLEKCTALAECVNDGIGLIDPKGEVIYTNGRLREILKIEETDLRGRQISDFLNPDQMEKFRQLREAVRNGTQEPYELDIATDQGTIANVRILPKPVYDSNHRFVGSIGIFTDITELKQSELSVRRAGDALRSLYNGVPIPSYTWQLQGDDIVLVEYNPAAAKITEGRVAEFLGRKASEMYERRPDIVDDLQRCLREKATIKREMDYVHATTGEVHNLIVTYLLLPPDRVLVCTEVATEHKKTSAQLLVMEERWQLLLKDSLDVISNISPDGTVLAVNRTVSGRPAAEMTGTCVFDFIPEDQRDFVKSTIDKVCESGTAVTYEIYIKLPSTSETVWFENRAVPLVIDGHVDSIIILSHDISAEKTAYEKLNRSEIFNRAVVENSPLGISVRSSNGTLLSANKAWKRIWGHTDSEIDEIMAQPRTELKFDSRDAYLGDWIPKVKRIYEEGGNLHVPAVKVNHPREGKALWVSQYFYAIKNENGEVDRVVIMTENVTDRKIAYEKLQESEQKFRTLSENVPGMIYRGNPDWSIEFYSSIEEISGFSSDEFANRKKWSSIIHPDDLERVLEESEGLDVSHESVVQVYRIITKDGRVRWIEDHKLSRFTEEGFFLGVDGVAFDITERKLAEEEVKKFQTISDNANYGAAICDLNANILYINECAAAMHGYTASELIGENISVLHTEEQMTQVRGIIERSLNRFSCDAEEVWHRRKDGTVFPTLMSGTIVRDSQDNPIFLSATAIDITDQIQYQRMVQESEEKFRATIESSPDAITVMGMDGSISLSNKAALQLFGYESSDEVVGRNALEFFAEEDKERAQENMEKMLSVDTIKNIEYTLLTKDNRRFQAEVSASLIRDISGSPTAYVGVIKDITERKFQENALRESEEKFRVIAESTPIPVVISRRSDGKVLFANSQIAPAFRYSEEELKHINTAIFYDDIQDLHKIEAMLEKGPVRNYELKGRRSDGTTFWGTLSMDRIIFAGDLAYLGAFYDITEQKKMMEALREGEARFRELADLLPQTIYEADTAGNIIFTNRHGFESTGFTPEDLEAGVNVLDFFSDADKEMVKARIPELLSGEPVRPTEYNLIRKDGGTFPVISYSTRILSNGEPVGLRGIVIDITERKRTEIELLKANEELRKERAKLENANIALHEVLEAIDDRRKEVIKRLNTNMERLVKPIMESLKRKSNKDTSIIVTNLERTLQEITSPFTRDLETRIAMMTQREIQICDMIRAGMRSGEIASALDISELTVQKHRQQIRKKLGLAGKKANLASYLCSMPRKNLENY